MYLIYAKLCTIIGCDYYRNNTQCESHYTDPHV